MNLRLGPRTRVLCGNSGVFLFDHLAMLEGQCIGYQFIFKTLYLIIQFVKPILRALPDQKSGKNNQHCSSGNGQYLLSLRKPFPRLKHFVEYFRNHHHPPTWEPPLEKKKPMYRIPWSAVHRGFAPT